jgi:uncharacterized membrane protein
MQNFCAKCGASLPQGARFCPACGQKISDSDLPPFPTIDVGGLSDNVAAFLCYLLGFICGIIFLNLEPYRTKPYVRFHAWQSILFSMCWIGFSMVEHGTGLFFLSWLFTWPVHLAMLIFWIILLVKAYNGERYKLPLLGNLAQTQAEKQASL